VPHGPSAVTELRMYQAFFLSPNQQHQSTETETESSDAR